MRIIAVDDEFFALEALEEAIRQAAPEAELHCFREGRLALAYAGENKVDVAFLDIRMPQPDGLSLALQLKEKHPDTNIVFVTGYSQYAEDAFSLHASGYVTKPVHADAIRRELEDLRYGPSIPTAPGIYIQCFGNFAVYLHGELLHFSRSKPKELLAYLVHKCGAGISASEIAAILWEDKLYSRSVRSQVQTAVSQMMATLKEMGIAEIITKKWNSIAIDKTKISCDYYDFLAGKPQAINAYVGEYLTEYSWAEFTAIQLMQKTKKFNELQ